MRIAVTSTGDSPESDLSEHFGRCHYFVIVNSETMNYEFVLNPGKQMQNGAGPKAAAVIADNRAEVLLTGIVGEKASDILKRINIEIIDGFKNIKVREAVNQYLLQKNKNKQGAE
jgi:predicted Fe-Mo cluster-binding NifX family protein